MDMHLCDKIKCGNAWFHDYKHNITYVDENEAFKVFGEFKIHKSKENSNSHKLEFATKRIIQTYWEKPFP